MSGTVFVVHCIDTEGPLYESPEVPFEQIKRIFGINIAPTRENLIKLQKGTLDLGIQGDAIRNLVDIHRITTRGSWDEVMEMVSEVTDDSVRTAVPDSNGNGWIFNWFCMDHVGFTGENPRRRDAGYHKIFDRYVALTQEQGRGDFIGFHYHPISHSGNYNDSGTAFWGGENLNQILTRKVIDRKWFPVAFRPGFHTERPDSNWFLEQWIPFDYGNQSYRRGSTGQVDLDGGRFGDWRHAPLEWEPYHPSHDDYQKKGHCRRWITRCLNMYARIRQLEQEDVNEAFAAAEAGKDVILSFTDHDYKDMAFEIHRVQEMIRQTAIQYPDVRFEYADALSAMRKALKLHEERFDLTVSVDRTETGEKLVVRTSGPIFGPQPFLAIKTKSEEYLWDNFDFSVPGHEWTYTFDANTVPYSDVDTLGVATNNRFGVTKVVLLHSSGAIETHSYHE